MGVKKKYFRDFYESLNVKEKVLTLIAILLLSMVICYSLISYYLEEDLKNYYGSCYEEVKTAIEAIKRQKGLDGLNEELSGMVGYVKIQPCGKGYTFKFQYTNYEIESMFSDIKVRVTFTQNGEFVKSVPDISSKESFVMAVDKKIFWLSVAGVILTGIAAIIVKDLLTLISAFHKEVDQKRKK